MLVSIVNFGTRVSCPKGRSLAIMSCTVSRDLAWQLVLLCSSTLEENPDLTVSSSFLLTVPPLTLAFVAM